VHRISNAEFVVILTTLYDSKEENLEDPGAVQRMIRLERMHSVDKGIAATWEVYMIETESGRLYTGIARSSAKRFAEHSSDKKKRAKFFRSDRPLRIVYIETRPTRSAALKREHEIKSFSRKKKLSLIAAIESI